MMKVQEGEVGWAPASRAQGKAVGTQGEALTDQKLLPKSFQATRATTPGGWDLLQESLRGHL